MTVQNGNDKTITFLAGDCFKKTQVKLHPGKNEVDKELWSDVVDNYSKKRLNNLKITY